MANAGYLFAQAPEQAVVDPDNPHIVVGHLKCAANELPLADAEVEGFGEYAQAVLDLLAEEKLVRHLEGHWYWASSEYPAAGVNLRNIAGPVYTIQDHAGPERVIGTLDEISAMSQLHDHAVYLHRAETYFVNKLDLEQKIAFVERRDLDYYTQAVQSSQLHLDATDIENEWRGGRLGFGDVTVTTTIPMFKKIRFHARDSLGYEKLELPPQLLETVACWFVPPDAALERLRAAGLIMGEALTGIANVVIEVAPMFVLCDPQDLGTVVDAHNLNRDALFVHDRYPGGIGYARRIMDNFPAIMAAVAEVVRHCSCPDGCPSCVGSALPPSAMTDLDSAVRGRIPNKAAARLLVDAILGDA